MSFEDLLRNFNGGLLDGAQKKLSTALKIEIYNVSNWANGRAFPSIDIRPKVAKALGVSEEVLMSALVETKKRRKLVVPESLKHLEDHLANTTLPAGPIPVLGVVSAEKFRFSFQAVPEEYIYAPCPPGHQCFGLKVQGQCMEPKISDGEYIIVAKTDYVDDGQLAVVRVGEDCTLKRVYRKPEKNHIELKPDNPKFKALKVKPDDMRIVGRATGKFSKF